MPFEPGNDLGKKGKVFDNALRRAIAQDDGKRVREAAEVLLTKASEGEPWALNMLADRLDGKAVQSVEQKTELTAAVEMSNRPQLTKEEWLAAHGLGSAGG